MKIPIYSFLAISLDISFTRPTYIMQGFTKTDLSNDFITASDEECDNYATRRYVLSFARQ